MAPSTSTLSASGSRNAPDRVTPWRRASHPSMPSLAHNTNHTMSASHDPSLPSIMTNRIGATSTRATVTALAHVLMASGEYVEVMVGRKSCRRHGDQVGAEGIHDVDTVDAADGQVVGHLDDAVDLGSLAVTSGQTRRVDQHVDGGADEGVAPRRGDDVLALAQLGQPLSGQDGIDLVVEGGGVRTVLFAVDEEAAPVESGVLHEGEEGVVVGLGLARVADDEVGSEGSVGPPPADVGDAAEEAVAVAPPPHPAQQRLRHVLQRQVEVR